MIDLRLPHSSQIPLGAEGVCHPDRSRLLRRSGGTLVGGFTSKCQGKIRTQPGKFSLAGGGLPVGRMGADSVTKEYKAPFLWTDAELKNVTFNVSGERYRDLETEALAMLSRE